MIKVKKFNNLWTMGLILCGSLLVLFYIAKLFFPQFIIGVAEVPNIIKIGNYIQNHKWCYHIFNIIIAYLGGYIYCCACCRTKILNMKGNLVLLSVIILLRLISIFIPEQYNALNYAIFCLLPFLICCFNKTLNKQTFISTIVCFSVDIISQVFSAEIRNLFVFATHINPATMIILLIDTWIWRSLLYCFFNYKKEGE